MTDQLQSGPVVEARFPASAIPWISGVRLVPGDAVDLVNISRSGLLVESPVRLVPGTVLFVSLEGGAAPIRCRGKVVRCQVSTISDGSLRYHCGIQFDQKIDALDVPKAPLVETGAGPTTAPVPSPGTRTISNRW